MRFTLAAALAATAFAYAVPAAAQTDTGAPTWTGAYVGVKAGWDTQPNDGDERINFDTNLDGTFGDTVFTNAGANAFPGNFCGGKASTTGCRDDQDSLNLSAHIGYDYQIGSNIVVGAVLEGGLANAEDYVTAYSTTPAFYTMTRRLREYGQGRLRAGYAFGPESRTLVYGTGGAIYGKIVNRFRSSNFGNSRIASGNDWNWGYTAGGGVEHRFSDKVSVGILYLFTSIDADDARVRVGPNATNTVTPFTRTNAAGTDFARSHSKFVTHQVGVTASYRF